MQLDSIVGDGGDNADADLFFFRLFCYVEIPQQCWIFVPSNENSTSHEDGDDYEDGTLCKHFQNTQSLELSAVGTSHNTQDTYLSMLMMKMMRSFFSDIYDCVEQP